MSTPLSTREPPGSGPDAGALPADCCSLTAAPLSADAASRTAVVFKALADPMRLRLLSHVAAQGCENVCACDLTAELGIAQSTVSHHMKRLVDAGLLTREQRGRWAHYTVVPEAFEQLRGVLGLD